jgi:hypothetical protein
MVNIIIKLERKASIFVLQSKENVIFYKIARKMVPVPGRMFLEKNIVLLEEAVGFIFFLKR